MMRHRSETWLAWFSLFATTIHFTLETWYHMVWGQPLQALLVDYISVALMIFGAVTSLRIRPRSAAGLLAAAWTYNLGFGWRSAFGRLEALEPGQRRGVLRPPDRRGLSHDRGDRDGLGALSRLEAGVEPFTGERLTAGATPG
jgi:hypothetical protein